MNHAKTEQRPLPDTQSEQDFRGHFIEQVGVSGIEYPFQFSSGKQIQSTIGSWQLSVSLAKSERGTHMSRFMETLSELDSPVTLERLKEVCGQIRSRLMTDNAYLEVQFPWFLEKSAPSTGRSGLIDLKVKIEISTGITKDCLLSLTVPATSLCPCSKSISDFGAHNQRCHLDVTVRLTDTRSISICELARMTESAASAQVFSVIKRSDEKVITEQAYLNPKFAEDSVRDLASILKNDERIGWFRCRVENFESIHNHNAFAQIQSGS